MFSSTWGREEQHGRVSTTNLDLCLVEEPFAFWQGLSKCLRLYEKVLVKADFVVLPTYIPKLPSKPFHSFLFLELQETHHQGSRRGSWLHLCQQSMCPFYLQALELTLEHLWECPPKKGNSVFGVVGGESLRCLSLSSKASRRASVLFTRVSTSASFSSKAVTALLISTSWFRMLAKFFTWSSHIYVWSPASFSRSCVIRASGSVVVSSADAVVWRALELALVLAFNSVCCSVSFTVFFLFGISVKLVLFEGALLYQ